MRHVLVRRRRSAPSWCGPTGAATSPTTARASWSATRSSPCPASGAGAWPTPWPTCAPSSSWSSTSSPTWASPDAGRLRGLPRGVGRPRVGPAPQDRRHRRPPHPGAVDARLRPERGPRHGDVRPHRAVRHRRQGRHLAGRRGHRRDHARGRRRGGRAGWCPVGARTGRPWTGPTWCGATMPGATTTSPRSAGGRERAPRCARAGDHGVDVARAPVPVAGPSLRLRGRLAEAGVADGLAVAVRKPEWLRAPRAPRRRAPRAEADASRPRPGHRVRGGRLPEPLGVLGRRHGHVHDQR